MPGYFTLINDKAIAAASDSSEVARKSNVVILTPETRSPLVFEQKPILVGRIFYPG